MRQIRKRALLLCMIFFIVLTTLPCTYAKTYTQEELEIIELDTEYSNVGPFLNRVARVEKNGRYGFINENGLEVIPEAYSYASNFYNGLALIKPGYGYTYIDNRGNEIISNNYRYYNNFSHGLAKVETDNKTTFIDKIGKEVFSFTESFADNFSEGMCRNLNGSAAPSDGFVTNTREMGFS